MTVSFYGRNSSESTGGVADRGVETAKQETTGGIGVRANRANAYALNNNLSYDTVCFQGKEKTKNNAGAAVVNTLGIVLLVGGGLGMLHKYSGKIKSDKIKNIVNKAECVTEPCHKACTWVKKNSYDKIVKLFKKG